MRYCVVVFAVGMLAGTLASSGQQGMPQPVLTAQPSPAAAGQAGGGAAAATPSAANPVVEAAVAGQNAVGDTAAGAPPVDSLRYVIGVSDVLTVSVWKELALTGNLLVRPDGMISLPLTGDVQAAGLTPMQLSVELTKRLKKFIADPVVTVTVFQVNSKRIYMIGEVGHAGPLPITPDMSPLQAIAAAGGVSPFANTKKIYILRGTPGHQQKIFFNYKKALKDGDMQGVSLLPGDTIVVP